MNRYAYRRPFARKDQPGLHTAAPCADDYHALATVYQRLELHDLVTATAQWQQSSRAGSSGLLEIKLRIDCSSFLA